MEEPRIPGIPGIPLQGSPNLIKQTSAFRADRPHGYAQSFVLDALVVLAAFAVSYYYRTFVDGFSWSALLPVVIAVALFSMFSVMEMMLFRDWDRRVLVVCLEIVGFLYFFHDISYMYLSVVALVLFLFLLWGDLTSRRVLKNNLEIHFFRTVRPLLNKIITATILMAVVLYLPRWDARQGFFSAETFSYIYTSGTHMAMNFYPEIALNGTVSAFARSIAKSELNAQQAFQDLPETMKAKELDKAEVVIVSSLEKTFKVTLDPARTMRETCYGLITDALDAFEKKFGNQFLLVWAIIIFFLIRGFGVIAQTLFALLAAVCYQLLLATNIIHVAGESRIQEVVEYS